MKYKAVEDKNKKWHVKYKKNWYSPWRWCRQPAPKGESQFTQKIWEWPTKKGAETFIYLKLK